MIALPNIIRAQYDTTSDASKVFQVLNIDESISFTQNDPLYLRTNLDKESLEIIKEGISKKYFTRQRREGTRFVFDTLRITDREIKSLDSLVTKLPISWTKNRISKCGIGREIVICKSCLTDAENRIIHQIMEPIFLRDHTLVFTYYKRENFDKYAEFTVFVKVSSRWELWKKAIIIIGEKIKISS